MTNHDDRMKRDVNATYEQMARGVIPYEDGITKLGQIADNHRAACKAELDKRLAEWDAKFGGAR